MVRRLVIALTFALLLPSLTAAQTPARVERNVIYGMHSGLALLMDVYRPEPSNGLAVVAIQGSGWYRSMRGDAAQLKEAREVSTQAQRLAAAGYTVFSINHRSAPRFHYPDPVEDAQRAVRFVRARAADYGIDPNRIGAWGSSSGGYLALMLGVLDGAGDAAAPDPILRVSAKVQSVAVLFPPTEIALLFKTSDRQGTIGAFMGFAYQDPQSASGQHPDDVEARAYRLASPVNHATADDPAVLLIHGDLDTTVPIAQSELMEAALKKAGVEVQFLRVAGGKHGPDFQFKTGDPRLPDHMGESVKWFEGHLKPATGTPRAARTIDIPAGDGGIVRADEYGRGERAVVLAHGGRLDRASWRRQATELADAGFRVLAIDFRAAVAARAGGETSCLYDSVCLAKDVLAAVRYLRGSGARTVAIVGASLGGGAAAQAAIDGQAGSIDRVVLIAHMTVEAPEKLHVPALFILARDDASGSGPRLPEIRRQYERAQGPKELIVLDGAAHAQFVFDTPQGDQLRREILRFVSAP